MKRKVSAIEELKAKIEQCDAKLVELKAGESCKNVEWLYGLPKNHVDYERFDAQVQHSEEYLASRKKDLKKYLDELQEINEAIVQQKSDETPCCEEKEKTRSKLQSRKEKLEWRIDNLRTHIMRNAKLLQDHLETNTPIDGAAFFETCLPVVEEKIAALKELRAAERL